MSDDCRPAIHDVKAASDSYLLELCDFDYWKQQRGSLPESLGVRAGREHPWACTVVAKAVSIEWLMIRSNVSLTSRGWSPVLYMWSYLGYNLSMVSL